nr:MAG TPA: hypothetical protein [Caudoviricetes sp.]
MKSFGFRFLLALFSSSALWFARKIKSHRTR